jgi:hypothetical protein
MKLHTLYTLPSVSRFLLAPTYLKRLITEGKETNTGLVYIE